MIVSKVDQISLMKRQNPPVTHRCRKFVLVHIELGSTKGFPFHGVGHGVKDRKGYQPTSQLSRDPHKGVRVGALAQRKHGARYGGIDVGTTSNVVGL